MLRQWSQAGHPSTVAICGLGGSTGQLRGCAWDLSLIVLFPTVLKADWETCWLETSASFRLRHQGMRLAWMADVLGLPARRLHVGLDQIDFLPQRLAWKPGCRWSVPCLPCPLAMPSENEPSWIQGGRHPFPVSIHLAESGQAARSFSMKGS